MIQLLLLMAATTTPAPPALPPGVIIGPDPPQGRMAATNTYLLPAKVPECQNTEQAQRAAEERIKGYQPECLRPIAKEQKPRRP